MQFKTHLFNMDYVADYYLTIAPVGQVPAHAPHSMQAASEIS
jgi:hypothetical protein